MIRYTPKRLLSQLSESQRQLRVLFLEAEAVPPTIDQGRRWRFDLTAIYAPKGIPLGKGGVRVFLACGGCMVRFNAKGGTILDAPSADHTTPVEYTETRDAGKVAAQMGGSGVAITGPGERRVASYTLEEPDISVTTT